MSNQYPGFAFLGSLQAEDLRKRGDQRKLDEILRPRTMRP